MGVEHGVRNFWLFVWIAMRHTLYFYQWFSWGVRMVGSRYTMGLGTWNCELCDYDCAIPTDEVCYEKSDEYSTGFIKESGFPLSFLLYKKLYFYGKRQ